jgi:MoxR-like ATPase
MSTTLIHKYLYGWDHLEPALLGCLAQGYNVLLLGSHGNGKTSFTKYVSDAFSNGKDFKLGKYVMDKESVLTMVGALSPVALREGRMEFTQHERSVFNMDALLLDEITRARDEQQNMVLEMLEEKTVFGYPLKYRFVIATANDESYKATYKLDAALLDRFLVVLPVPGPTNSQVSTGPEEIEAAIRLNLFERRKNLEEANEQLGQMVKKVRATTKTMWSDKQIRDNVIEFTGKFFNSLFTNLKSTNSKKSGSKEKIVISWRQVLGQFPKTAMAISSYYKVQNPDDDGFLQNGTWDAIKYSLFTKLGIPIETLKEKFDLLSDILTDTEALLERIQIKL